MVCGGFRIVLGSLGILACLDDVFWCKDLLKTSKTTLQIGIRRPQRPAGLDLVMLCILTKTDEPPCCAELEINTIYLVVRIILFM